MSRRLRVKSIDRNCQKMKVYDMQVTDCHNFCVNGINVHNCAEPNLMNIPSHATDIRHMFRATPGYVMLSSDYSRMCAVVKLP